MLKNTPCQLLASELALLRAFFWRPLRQFAILEKTRMAWLHLFEKVTTDLTESTQLGLEVDIVSVGNLHPLLNGDFVFL